MKFTPQQYAQAFWQVADEAPEKEYSVIVLSFISAIKKYGDSGRADKIIQSIEEYKVKRDGGNVINIEYARQQPGKMTSKIEKSFEKKDLIQTRINKSLIAGVRVTISGEQELDLTMRRKLSRLFT